MQQLSFPLWRRPVLLWIAGSACHSDHRAGLPFLASAGRGRLGLEESLFDCGFAYALLHRCNNPDPLLSSLVFVLTLNCAPASIRIRTKMNPVADQSVVSSADESLRIFVIAFTYGHSSLSGRSTNR